MDLHFTAAEASEVERAAVDALLGAPASRWEGARTPTDADRHVAFAAPDGAPRPGRRELLPALHAVNDRVGWISEGALNYICQRLDVAPADAYGVASFYALFATQERPGRILHVCDDIACAANGADALCATLEETLGPPATALHAGSATWSRSPCLGLCDRAPAGFVAVAGVTHAAAACAHLTAQDAVSLLHADPLSAPASKALPQAGSDGLRLLRRIGRVDPSSLEEYRAAGGYTALARSLTLGPPAVVAEVIAAKLVGRGGAAFPTGRKWEAVAAQPSFPHYIICNADESEPGTFKDRVLMEDDPFAVIEAMTIGAYAGGCQSGFLYIRGEYPLAMQRLQSAIVQARAANLLGENILANGFGFDIRIYRGAGAYICGEETALFNSIEGLRPEPRNKPPFPVSKGLFGQPTIVNNVETLVNVLDIINEGAAAFRARGTPDSSGTKLFCVSGNVTLPGLYEVPFGTTVRELLSLAGGVAGGKALQAVLLGGAAGAFVRADEIDTKLSFEDVRKVGSTIGSGVAIVFDSDADLLAVLRRIAAFFRDESCGQCVPCRVGTVRQEELLARLRANRPIGSIAQERALLGEIGQVMRDASICGLGQTASSAIESAIAKFGLFA
ncbi:MAG: NAD(P)H-dependent oxidoreductase subunit E [Candidatus Eremiobacteraeota bacterium]|nr:NAD(P)H-dependent oxidoreductase subunit E [Candidatus Eremiobacteraeota bacterium]